VDEIDEATDVELLHRHLGGLSGQPEEAGELGDVYLPVEIDRFEGSVFSEGDAERLERLVHEDLHPVLEAPDSGDDFPSGGEAVVRAHGRFHTASR
jgi:hypothetical protein